MDPALTPALTWASETLGPITRSAPLLGGWTSTLLRLTPENGAPAVLRLMTNEPWRTHGEALTTRESEIQRMLAATTVPAPRSLALDAVGERCGHPAHLMTLVPGAVDLDRADGASLGALAETLAAIHDVAPTIGVRDYQSWAWEAKYVVPDWATEATLWADAFDLLRTEPPSYEPTFIHRDFQPRNVLWRDDGIGGVVDWVETSIGPAWLDVAHCATNLAIAHGEEVAVRFMDAYAACTGRKRQAYFEVMDVVGFLPPPGRRAFITEPAPLARMEARLRHAMLALRG